MNTKLQTIIFVVGGIAAFCVFFGIIWAVKTEKRLKRFFVGKKAKDLEDTIIALQNEILKLKEYREKNETEIAILNQKLKKSLRGLETIRFNPFPDQGGNQSFAIGILNEEENGVVISSLYSRERMSIFAKPIKNGKSEYDLTNEEKEVLKKARVGKIL